jgi:hypothetical protein
MRYSEPFLFWQLKPDGENAYRAYEHIHSYFEGVTTQYTRIYEIWAASSAIDGKADPDAAFHQKRKLMKQVVRDIHSLLVFLQVISKTLQTLSNKTLYPNFSQLSALNDSWKPYFYQYRDPRNTLEHYDDQVLGLDTKSNSPGWGLSLSASRGFSLGTQVKVPIDETAYRQLENFMNEFEDTIQKIVEPTPPSQRATRPAAARG